MEEILRWRRNDLAIRWDVFAAAKKKGGGRRRRAAHSGRQARQQRLRHIAGMAETVKDERPGRTVQTRLRHAFLEWDAALPSVQFGPVNKHDKNFGSRLYDKAV